MRWMIVAAVLITACAHQPRFEHQDECINPTMESMSWRLLRRGLARYARPEAYTISDYSDCLYRIAEREARASGAGIWSR